MCGMKDEITAFSNGESFYIKYIIIKYILKNIVAKEEISHHEQFSLLLQCFDKQSAVYAPDGNGLTISIIYTHFDN